MAKHGSVAGSESAPVVDSIAASESEALQRYRESRDLVLQLQRSALRVSELGYVGVNRAEWVRVYRHARLVAEGFGLPEFENPPMLRAVLRLFEESGTPICVLNVATDAALFSPWCVRRRMDELSTSIRCRVSHVLRGPRAALPL